MEGAARLHEFIIKVYHPDPQHASKINLHLHVKWATHLYFYLIWALNPSPNPRFPKTYPNLAGPIFSLEKPITGLSDPQVTKLSHEVNLEVQKLRGSEMVFTVRTELWILLFILLIYYKDCNLLPRLDCQQHNTTRGSGGLVSRSNESTCVGSGTSSYFVLSLSFILCSCVTHSRLDTREKWRKQNERKNELVGLLKSWTNKYKQMLCVNSWPRNNSTKLGNAPIQRLLKFLSWVKETFKFLPRSLITKWRSTVFDSTLSSCFIPGVVKSPLFLPFFFSLKSLSTQAGLGIVYTADPIVDDIVSTSPLELYVVTFESQYYTTTQGRKKLKQVEQEIQKLTTVRHPKLITVFAVKLYMPHSGGPPQLMVLSEQLPALTLHDVLEDSELLREDRVSVCFVFFIFGFLSPLDCCF